jgi:hypothetical protein
MPRAVKKKRSKADRPHPIVSPHYLLCELVARQLMITNHETRAQFKWVPTIEQIVHWEAVHRFTKVYNLKGRQIFMSTAQCLYDLLFAVINTALGNRVEVWLVWDSEDKVHEKVDDIADWLRQLGIPHKYNEGDHKIFLPRVDKNGKKLKATVIRGLTAGGKRAGSGLSASLVHMSETPYWADADKTWHSLKPCWGKGQGRAVLETTMAAGSKLCRTLWDEKNEWKKIFFPISMHESYKLDPSDCRYPEEIALDPLDKHPLEPDVKKWLKEEGFTDERTMAFMQHELRGMASNKLETLREYPETPEHCFNLATGRFIKHRPVVTDCAFLDFEVRGSSFEFEIRRWPEDTSGQCAISVDTCGIAGRSRHAIVVVDRLDGQICASWVSSDAGPNELAELIYEVQKLYTCYPKDVDGYAPWLEEHRDVPVAIIEANGVGDATLKLCNDLGVYVYEFWQKDRTREIGLDLVREAIEGGHLFGPDELAEECDELHVVQKDEQRKKFKGLKDLLMALANCYFWRQENPYRTVEDIVSRDETFDLHERMTGMEGGEEHGFDF